MCKFETAMKVLLDIKEDKVQFMMELLNNLDFVEAVPLTDKKTEQINNIKTSVEELKQIRNGQLKGIPAKELLDEL